MASPIIIHNIIFVVNNFYRLLFRAPGGELQMVLDKDEVPAEPEVARLMRQILDGLHYLHTINVAHLDIKVRAIKKYITKRRNHFLGTFTFNNSIHITYIKIKPLFMFFLYGPPI